ncbi:MAG: L,D-transpeptidase [Roseibacillus sp.]|nr:L,D-transpeptidase [Roseibacillus sp.]
MNIASFLALLLLLTAPFSSLGAPTLEGITFALDSKRTFLPLIEASRKLGWSPRADKEKRTVVLNGKTLSTGAMRTFTDGAILISLETLTKAGATVTPGKDESRFKVSFSSRHFRVVRASKHTEINLKEQRLRAWEGERLVLETNISSGKRGSTPSGSFKAGPYKARKHYSSRYNNAYMPYSVQVTGHIFIHGFKDVPKYPASHGCIRLPYLTGGNPARFFYEWIDKGTPIKIVKQ